MIEPLKYMDNNELMLPAELPEGLEIMPGMEDVNAGLLAHANIAAANLIGQLRAGENPAILAPLNGAVMPTIYLIDNLRQQLRGHQITLDQFNKLCDQIRFAEYKGSELIMTGNPIQNGQRVNVIDDIADTLKLAQKLLKQFPNITLFAPCQKEHTAGIAATLPGLTMIAGDPVANKWILSGYCMDPGNVSMLRADSSKPSNFELNYVSALCRSAKVGLYQKSSGPLIYEQLVGYLIHQQLPLIVATHENTNGVLANIESLDGAKKDNKVDSQLNIAARIHQTTVDDGFLDGRLLRDLPSLSSLVSV